MSKKRKSVTDMLNEQTFRVIFDQYKLLCLDMFRWEGLPEGIEERHIENQLFKRGVACMVNDPDVGLLALQADPAEQLNVYGDPVNWWATGLCYHKRYPADSIAIIRNNKLQIPTQDFILFYANKLAEVERTMDTNVKRCKVPFVFAVDEKSLLSFKQIFNKIDGNEPVIFADKMLQMGAVQLYDTKVQFIGNDLQAYEESVRADLLTFLGVDNVAHEKAERLITDEAQSNNQLIRSFGEIMLESRQLAAQRINELYGLNVTVNRRVDLAPAPVQEGRAEDAAV